MAQTEPYSLEKLYDQRFDATERSRKMALWKELCRSFFQKYVKETDTVLDLGAGYCEFINNIRCAKKYAVDLNEETKSFAAPDVEVIMSSATDLSAFKDGTVDVVFASNIFEHLPTKEVLMEVLREIYRVLKPGGSLMVLQPNIHYAYREYWDYLDHYLPLSHVSLAEAFGIVGLKVREVRPRLLPYSFKSRLPQSTFLLRVYLAVHPLHMVFGRQMFLLGVK
jgi:ubiquinone/menaquinone biosynthesis C-methylase UbiE